MKKTNNNKKQTAKKKVQPSSKPAVMIPHLSPCAIDYLKVLSDPWTMPSNLPCIPDVVTIPSRKYQTKSRGTFTVGTGGCGWVAASPFLAAANNYGASGGYVDPPVIFTTSAYTGTAYDWTCSGSTMSTGVSLANAAGPATFQNLGAPVQIRLVGSGLRVRYSGTELNRAGRLILYRSRSNSSVDRPSNPSDLLTDPTIYADQVTRAWQGVTYVPDAPELIGYSTQASYSPVMTGLEGAARRSLLAIVTGAVAGVSFEFELTSYFETIGPNQVASPSHADPIGFGAIMSALPEKVTSLGGQTFSAMQRGALRALETTTSGLFNLGTAAVLTSAASYLSTRPQMMLQNGPVITEL